MITPTQILKDAVHYVYVLRVIEPSILNYWLHEAVKQSDKYPPLPPYNMMDHPYQDKLHTFTVLFLSPEFNLLTTFTIT